MLTVAAISPKPLLTIIAGFGGDSTYVDGFVASESAKPHVNNLNVAFGDALAVIQSVFSRIQAIASFRIDTRATAAFAAHPAQRTRGRDAAGGVRGLQRRFGDNFNHQQVQGNGDSQNNVAVFAANQPQGDDPLGSELGTRRILRTSPLTPVPAIC